MAQQPFWLNVVELMQVFPMMLIMVLLNLAHQVQKLLCYLLVLKPNTFFAPVFTRSSG